MMHLGHSQLVVDGVSSLPRCLLIGVPLVISGQFLFPGSQFLFQQLIFYQYLLLLLLLVFVLWELLFLPLNYTCLPKDDFTCFIFPVSPLER